MRLLGYAFMPEHLHLLLLPTVDEYSISSFLISAKTPVTNKALAYLKDHPRGDVVREQFLVDQPGGKAFFRLWQRGGGYDRNATTTEECLEKLRYMHNNPVVRGLCQSPTDWKWSSAADYEGVRTGPIPIKFFGG